MTSAHDHHDPEAHAAHADHAEHAEHAGHGGHAGHAAMFGRLFWIMLVLAVPVVAFDAMFVHLVGYHLPERGLVPWISPLLGTVMYLWGGRPFLRGALDEIRGRSPGMMLLVALGITVAYLASLGSSLGLLDPQLDFWWELALLVVIMLLGHWLEMRSLAGTAGALDALAALLPETAERIDGDSIQQVAPDELRAGDLVLVRPGASIPADGTIAAGEASLDESMITGESLPVLRGEGEQVVAGTIATDASLRIEVTQVGEQTALAGIRHLVAEAQSSSSRAQRLADRAAALLFWYALGAAVITAAAWLVLGTPEQAVVRVITVLVIACPHALGLAIPLVVAISTEKAARSGVLVRDRLSLETLRRVDAVALDKTGTLTRGEPAVLHLAAVRGGEDELLARAAAAESESEHPLGRAIRRAAEERGLRVLEARQVTTEAATGVTADVDGVRIAVGGPRLLEQHGAEPVDAASQWQRQGAIILHVLADGEVIGAIALADEIRPDSARTVEALHREDVQVVMMTGDAPAVAEHVAAQLGIDEVHAQVRPEDKARIIGELQQRGRRVAMVGDGVNDAPALAAAGVGIAIGAGTDVAIGSAGLILASSDPRGILSARRLSRAGYRTMLQNLWWAAGYNLLAVPLAAGVLAPVGVLMPMSVGALLMSASTVIVALNAQLLRRVDMSPEASPG